MTIPKSTIKVGGDQFLEISAPSPNLLVFSVAKSCPTLRPHGRRQTRLPHLSPTPRVFSNSCPLSRWCHPTISSSVVPFSSRLQSFPASGSFPMSRLFSSVHSIGASTSASVLPVNIQHWFPLGLTGLISLLCKKLSRVFSNTTVQRHQTLPHSALSLLYGPTLTSVHDHWKNHSFDYMDICWQSGVWFLIRCLGLS